MDKKEFDAAVRQYQDTVYRVALHALASPSDAEDVTQEVFLRLLTNKTNLQSEEHLRHWLLRVTLNVSSNLRKSFWRRNRVSIDEIAEQACFEQEEERELYRTVLSLPEKYRTVLVLFYYEELSTAEIAEVMSLKQSAVTTRLSRAREMLKNVLGEGWQDEE